MYFTSDDGFQDMFFYQPTLNTMKYKNTSTGYVISCKSKGVYNSKLIALNGDFLPNTKYFFNNTPLLIEKKKYTTKIVNVYIVYDLDNWPKNPLRNFTLKNCMFGATNLVKNNDKEKHVHSSYAIAFEGKGSWSITDDFGRNS